jgi:hypothetical protein
MHCSLQTGYAGLEDPLQTANDPVDEAWIYDPRKPLGGRFTATGDHSGIARLYHSTALLTSEGDALITGCSNCKYVVDSPLIDHHSLLFILFSKE